MTNLDIHMIDQEHADLMSSMTDAINFVGTDKEKCAVFRKLVDDLARHFLDEEEIMKDNEYFIFSKHKNIHRKFIAAAEDLYSQALNANNCTEINDLLIILSKYSASHFEIADMAFRFKLLETV